MPRYLVSASFRIDAATSDDAENIVQDAVEGTSACFSTEDVSAICSECEDLPCSCEPDEE